MTRLFAALPLLALTACGPVSPERAADMCEDRANAAVAPTGEVSIGVNSDGKVRSGFEIGVTSDYIRGRDPQVVYETCVYEKSGQPPIRPLVLEPGLLR